MIDELQPTRVPVIERRPRNMNAKLNAYTFLEKWCQKAFNKLPLFPADQASATGTFVISVATVLDRHGPRRASIAYPITLVGDSPHTRVNGCRFGVGCAYRSRSRDAVQPISIVNFQKIYGFEG